VIYSLSFLDIEAPQRKARQHYISIWAFCFLSFLSLFLSRLNLFVTAWDRPDEVGKLGFSFTRIYVGPSPLATHDHRTAAGLKLPITHIPRMT